MRDRTTTLETARRYLGGETELADLTEWLTSRLGWIVDDHANSEEQFAARALHLALLAEDGEIEERELREQLAVMLAQLSPA